MNAIERYLLGLTLAIYAVCSLGISYELCHMTGH